MNVLVLGPLELRRGSETVAVRRGRPRRLLLSLVLRRGGAVPQETLIDQLWGDEPPVNAENALQILISYLRKAIRETGLRIDRTPAGYRLVVQPDDVDMNCFERLVDEARSASGAEERLDLASRALALWRGPALSEAADDPFAQGDIARLDELRLQAVEIRVAALLDLGRHEEALPELTVVVREHPFREAVQGQLALALYRTGRQADALRVLERAREALIEELGLDPSAELQQLAQRILRQDSGLDAPRRPVPATAGPSASSGEATEARPAEAVEADARQPSGASAPAGVRPPASLTALIGREEQLAGLQRALADHRLITLTGPAGAGKTRIAAECASRSTDTVWWADLSSAVSPHALHEAVATALGTAASTDDPVRELSRWVGQQTALLVLDTCEHVVDAARGLTVELLAACPRLTILTTSRRALGAAGELTWPVPPLSLPDPGDRHVDSIASAHAVQLFADRAALARPDFALTSSNAPAVAAACLLLDGLPLAIELAASHVLALTPAKIVELLDDRMRLIGEGRDGRDRHAGLRAAIDWSYELLSEEEALFLDRLSVFQAPFLLEAAAQVAGAGLTADGLALLLSLVRQSLVSVAGEDQFLLLDTVRSYAAARLAERAEEQTAARDRHALYYAHFAEEADRYIRGADQPGWLAELRAAGPDLRSALRHCFESGGDKPSLGARIVCSLTWFWSHEGAYEDASRWVQTARSHGPHDPLTEARLHLAAGMHAESVGDLRLSEMECRSAAERFAALGDSRGEARSLLHTGTALWASGRLEQAAAAQDRAIELFRAHRHDSGAGLGLVLRARTALEQDELLKAEELLEDAEHVLVRAGDPHLVGICLEQRARAHLQAGRLDEAAALAERSLEIFERVGYPEGAVAALQTLGSARLAAGQPRAAARVLAEATERALDLAHAPAMAEGMDLLAEALEASSGPAVAARLRGHADAVRTRSGVALTRAQGRRRQGADERLRQALADRWDVERARGAETPAAALLTAVAEALPR